MLFRRIVLLIGDRFLMTVSVIITQIVMENINKFIVDLPCNLY